MSQNNHFSFVSHVKDILSGFPDAGTCWIAFSGGLDSHVLLHTLSLIKNEIKPELVAVHVNHGLSRYAESWQKHCQSVCENHAIKFLTFTIDIAQKSNKGTEAFAREKRYEIFANLMMEHDLLLTAHHLNDQAETMLLQLIRGSGPDGLAGMPQSREFSNGFLVRPLLDYSREEIHEYALKESLHWVEDESNKSNQYDRNYLRNEIIPGLLTRWPGALKTIRRATRHQADARSLINEIAENDLETVCGDEWSKINLTEFSKLSLIRGKNVLRAWIKRNHMEIPNAQIIEKINDEVIHANSEKNPCIKWEGGEIRRYRRFLYVMRPLSIHDVKTTIIWDLKKTLSLTSGYLKADLSKGHGIRREMISSDSVEIRYRQGGEKIRPSGRDHTHELKKLYQDEGVLPWLRDRIPLIYFENELIAVGDLWIEHKYSASQSESGWKIKWAWMLDGPD